METLERLIVEHPFFADMPPADLTLVTGCASNVRYKKGEFIFREQEEADAFYLIRDGRLTLEVAAPGADPIVIQTLKAQDVLGWSWLFPPYRWSFDAGATEDTRVLRFDGKCLRAKCENHPELGYRFMKRFSGLMLERLQATRLELIETHEKLRETPS